MSDSSADSETPERSEPESVYIEIVSDEVHLLRRFMLNSSRPVGFGGGIVKDGDEAAEYGQVRV